MKNKMKIYVIENLSSGKKYVGQTRRGLELRFKDHCSSSSRCTYLKHAIRKYGKENFAIKEIDEALTTDESNEKEEFWIKELNTLHPDGYNLTTGGGWGYAFSEYSKEKMSESSSGKNNPMFGRKQSKEAIARITKAASIKVINLDTMQIFNSATEAKRKTGIDNSHIVSVCKGSLKTAGGCNWAYYSDYLKGNFQMHKPGKSKKVINLDTGEIFQSAAEAGRRHKLTRQGIAQACRGKSKMCGGVRWDFYKEGANFERFTEPMAT